VTAGGRILEASSFEDAAQAPAPGLYRVRRRRHVTRVVHFRFGDRHEIHIYGADGALLKTIMT
jgi:hypothetical protein